MQYRVRVIEYRPSPKLDWPAHRDENELLDLEIELEAFDFKRLLALMMDMMPPQLKE